MFLFRCDADLLLATLCTRTMHTREGSIVITLDCTAALASRDTLAKTVYARLFDWCAFSCFFFKTCFLGVTPFSAMIEYQHFFIFPDAYFRLVEKINRSVGQDPNSRLQVGVLDIYGFESFKTNRLVSHHF